MDANDTSISLASGKILLLSGVFCYICGYFEKLSNPNIIDAVGYPPLFVRIHIITIIQAELHLFRVVLSQTVDLITIVVV